MRYRYLCLSKSGGKHHKKKSDALNMGSCTRNDIDFFFGGGA